MTCPNRDIALKCDVATMAPLANTLHSRVVQRACGVLGSPEVLAKRLGMSRLLVQAWITGTVKPSRSVFFRIVDLLYGDAEHGGKEWESNPPGTSDAPHRI